MIRSKCTHGHATSHRPLVNYMPSGKSPIYNYDNLFFIYGIETYSTVVAIFPYNLEALIHSQWRIQKFERGIQKYGAKCGGNFWGATPTSDHKTRPLTECTYMHMPVLQPRSQAPPRFSMTHAEGYKATCIVSEQHQLASFSCSGQSCNLDLFL